MRAARQTESAGDPSRRRSFRMSEGCPRWRWGRAKFARLSALKACASAVRWTRSRSAKVRRREMSAVRRFGPRRILRPALPQVYCGGIANAVDVEPFLRSGVRQRRVAHHVGTVESEVTASIPRIAVIRIKHRRERLAALGRNNAAQFETASPTPQRRGRDRRKPDCR